MKPPLEVTPRYIKDEERFIEIHDAIVRYLEAICKIPVEWIVEYNEIVGRMKGE